MSKKESSKPFFMSFFDLGFWIRSARADARLARLKKQYSTEEAFDQLYAQTLDPWGFLNPCYRYQRLKYEKLLAILPQRRFTNVLDVGCGIGVFTRMVASHAERATGLEISSVAVREAERLSLAFPHVCYMQGELQARLPALAESFDLVVLADVLYYLSPLSDERLKEIIGLAVNVTAPGGIILVANHYFSPWDAGSRLVREIHQAVRWHRDLLLIEEQCHPFFLAGLYQKLDGEACRALMVSDAVNAAQ